jgi:hypothetical protein
LKPLVPLTDGARSDHAIAFNFEFVAEVLPIKIGWRFIAKNRQAAAAISLRLVAGVVRWLFEGLDAPHDATGADQSVNWQIARAAEGAGQFGCHGVSSLCDRVSGFLTETPR